MAKRKTQTKTLQIQRSQLAQLTDEIVQRKGRVARDLFGIGVRLRRIQKQELWRASGFGGFRDYLVHVGIPRASAYRFIRIAEHFNPAIATRYGVSKLDATLRYLAATDRDELPGDIFSADIIVRREDGQFESLRLHDATAHEVDAAARLLEKARVGRTRRAIPASWRKRGQRMEKNMPPAPPGTSRGDRVRFVRGSDGRLAVTFVAVPVDEVGAFIKAVRREL